MSADVLRAGGLLAAAAFAYAAYRLVVPQRGIMRCAVAASLAFSLTDLLIEHLANVYGIWFCVGSLQVARVPLTMLVQFVFQGIGLCLVMYAIMRRRRGLVLFAEVAAMSVVLAFVLFLLEFVWRDMGVTIYARPDTWVYVLAAWNALLAVLFTTFYICVRLTVGTDGIISKEQVLRRSRRADG